MQGYTKRPMAGGMQPRMGAQRMQAPVMPEKGIVTVLPTEKPDAQQEIVMGAEAIGAEQVREAQHRLEKYKAAKASVEARVKSSQRWWKMRNWEEIRRDGQGGLTDPVKPSSAWLWNCIVGKHADAIEAFPEPIVLPRMPDDDETAKKLSDIIPVVLQQNDFEEVYSDCSWQKMLEGTAVYGCFWDKTRNGGLGDVAIRRVDVLNLFWQPGITDIQQSREVFHVELVDNAALDAQYPQMVGKHKGAAMTVSKYEYDDSVDTSEMSPVVDWYYHKQVGGRKLLHYCKYCGETVLYATENDGELAQTGLYDDGEYPFVFDRLFPVQGSPCGYGYIDVGKSTQELIDTVNQAVAKNVRMAATPRYFIRKDGGVNEQEFADWSKPFVHTNGNMGTDSLQQIIVNPVGDSILTYLSSKVDELKFVTGNTDINNGSTSSGVTAASAIAALQETGGRSSKASTKSSYRAYGRLVTMVIERIRQFYDMQRCFRILGEMGQTQFTQFDNSGLVPQPQGIDFGVDMGYRLPVFDINVRAQKENPYQKITQNELALQFYQLGFFNPQGADQAMMALDMMDFKGKDELEQKLSQRSMMMQQLQMYQQIALSLASKYEPQTAQQIAQSIMGSAQAQGSAPGMAQQAAPTGMASDGAGGNSIVDNARARAAQASQPI